MGTIRGLPVTKNWLNSMERNDRNSRVAVERRIAFEVAMELRILPKFTDDGAPEGTVERPISVHGVPEVTLAPDEEPTVEITVDLLEEERVANIASRYRR